MPYVSLPHSNFVEKLSERFLPLAQYINAVYDTESKNYPNNSKVFRDIEAIVKEKRLNKEDFPMIFITAESPNYDQNDNITRGEDYHAAVLDDFMEFCEKHDFAPFARGGECFVTEVPENLNLLAKIYSIENILPEKGKVLYYTHKIFHTLFPLYFAKLHAVINTRDRYKTSFTGTVVERKFGDNVYDLYMQRRDSLLDNPDLHRFKTIIDICSENQGLTDRFFDIAETNFIISESSSGEKYEVYIDSLSAGCGKLNPNEFSWNYEDVKSLMDKLGGYKPSDYRRVESSIIRINMIIDSLDKKKE